MQRNLRRAVQDRMRNRMFRGMRERVQDRMRKRVFGLLRLHLCLRVRKWMQRLCQHMLRMQRMLWDLHGKLQRDMRGAVCYGL